MIEVVAKSTLSGPGWCRRTHAGFARPGHSRLKGCSLRSSPCVEGPTSAAALVLFSARRRIWSADLTWLPGLSGIGRCLRARNPGPPFRKCMRLPDLPQEPHNSADSPAVRAAVRLGGLKGGAIRDRAADRSSLSCRRGRVPLVCRGEVASPAVAGTRSRRGRSRRPGPRDP